eukprot:jgi/Chrzof1/9186/Cz03g39040.t1
MANQSILPTHPHTKQQPSGSYRCVNTGPCSRWPATAAIVATAACLLVVALWVNDLSSVLVTSTVETRQVVRVSYTSLAAQQSGARAVTDAAPAAGSTEQLPGSSKYSHIAVAVKTSQETALQRVPVQLLTFLKEIDNLLIIGDAPDLRVGNHTVVDVLHEALALEFAAKDNLADWEADLFQSVQQQDDSYRKTAAGFWRATNSTPTMTHQEHNLGWQLDAHKNLLGFKKLYQAYPDAQWYIMIDGDTYFLFDAFLQAAADYDPREPHYLGNAMKIEHCEGAAPTNKSHMFAHGGCGIILSHGAMLKMLPVLDSCIVKSRNCWAGDVRVGLCLEDANVDFTWRNDWLFFDALPKNLDAHDPCDAPLSFHHVSTHQIQALHQLKSSLREGRVLQVADLYQAFYANKAMQGVQASNETLQQVQVNKNRPGNDLLQYLTADWEQCGKDCNEHKSCRAWVWEAKDSYCWLKDKVTEAQNSTTRLFTGLASNLAAKYVCNNAT